MNTRFVHWPTLQQELSNHLDYFEGKILNAGCGTRPLILPNAKEVVNMDLQPFENVDVVGDLESIPFPDNTFDGIINVAVLEHVRRPWAVIKEFSRVIKSGGKLLCVVPFFQPIHYIPSDYFRFTPDGITSLLEDGGFQVVESIETHTIWHTIGWMCENMTVNSSAFFHFFLKPVAWITYHLSKYSKIHSKTFPNAITIIAKKI